MIFNIAAAFSLSFLIVSVTSWWAVRRAVQLFLARAHFFAYGSLSSNQCRNFFKESARLSACCMINDSAV